MRLLLRTLLLRLGSRAIVWIGITLFLVNVLIPDPIPLLDEILMLAGTILVSRWAKRAELAADPTAPGPEGRGPTQR